MTERFVMGVVLLALISGCSVEARGPGVVVEGGGTLVLDWTIEGTKDPNLCDLTDAETLDATVTWEDGAFVGEFQQSCRAFATSIDLAPGSYRAEAVLLDSSGRDRTTAVQIRPFDIFGDDELEVPIDFSAASFY